MAVWLKSNIKRWTDCTEKIWPSLLAGTWPKEEKEEDSKKEEKKWDQALLATKFDGV